MWLLIHAGIKASKAVENYLICQIVITTVYHENEMKVIDQLRVFWSNVDR